MSDLTNKKSIICISPKYFDILEEIAKDNDTNIMNIADELLDIGLKHSKYSSYYCNTR